MRTARIPQGSASPQTRKLFVRRGNAPKRACCHACGPLNQGMCGARNARHKNATPARMPWQSFWRLRTRDNACQEPWPTTTNRHPGAAPAITPPCPDPDGRIFSRMGLGASYSGGRVARGAPRTRMPAAAARRPTTAARRDCRACESKLWRRPAGRGCRRPPRRALLAPRPRARRGRPPGATCLAQPCQGQCLPGLPSPQRPAGAAGPPRGSPKCRPPAGGQAGPAGAADALGAATAQNPAIGAPQSHACPCTPAWGRLAGQCI